MSATGRAEWPTAAVWGAVVGVVSATAFVMARAFVDLAPLGDFLLIVVAATATMLVGTALRLPAGPRFALAQPVGIAVVAAVFDLPGRWRGVVPTVATFSALRSEMTESLSTFLDAVPPVEPSLGFVVPLAMALWFATTFGIFAAADSDSPLHANAAPLAVFVSTSVLTLGAYATAAASLLTAATVSLRLATRAARARRTVAVASTSTDPAAAVWGVGVPMLLVAGLVAGAASLVVPATGAGVVNLREIGRKDPPRTVTSPLVSVASMLRRGDEVELFRVRSASPHYWRLTALDRFDGRSWSSNSSYERIRGGGELRSNAPVGGDASTERHDFELIAEFTDWVPTVFQPTSIEVRDTVQFDPETSSVFLPVETGGAVDRYGIVSRQPRIDLANLNPAALVTDRSHPAAEVPRDISPRAVQIAGFLGDGLGPFETALALERFFHDPSFTYDTDVDYSRSSDPLGEFLEVRTGFCQQYATAFAAMARVLGIPARVAVGFVPGDGIRLDDGGWQFSVSSLDAHAWPELYFEGVGWVPFEPTPGRGNPDAQDWSIAPPVLSGTAPRGATTTGVTAPPTTTADDPPGDRTDEPAATTTPPEQVRTVDSDTDGVEKVDGSNPIPLVAWIAVLAVVATACAALVRARRRIAARADHPDDAPQCRVAAAWQRALVDLRHVGIEPHPAETPLEFAARATAELLEVLGEPLDLLPLGTWESRRRWAATPPDADGAVAACELADRLHARVWAHLDTASRAKAVLGGR